MDAARGWPESHHQTSPPVSRRGAWAPCSAAPRTIHSGVTTISTAPTTHMVACPRLARVPAAAHARGVRRAVALVVLAILVEAVQRATAGTDRAADRGALAGALAATRRRAAGR